MSPGKNTIVIFVVNFGCISIIFAMHNTPGNVKVDVTFSFKTKVFMYFVLLLQSKSKDEH